MFQLPQSFLQDSDLATFARSVGPCTLFETGETGLAAARFREPYEALAHAIIGQHLHSNAVKTIFERFCNLNKTGETGTHPPDASTLRTVNHDALKACGLSDSKIRALKELAEAQYEGRIPTARQAEKLDDETLIAQLTSLYGIGRWTVEMFLIFSLHRPDIFPADDYGIREGWRRIKKLPEKPSPRELYKIAADFAPHRTLLTCYCWQAKERLPAPEEASN